MPNFAPTNLTADTAPAPFVASSNNEVWPAWQAFDGTTADAWAAEVDPAWLQIDLGPGVAQMLGSYSISKMPTQPYTPANWTMGGSNDGSTWDIVDTRSGEVGWQTSEVRIYTCAVQTTAYRYFRITITGQGGNYMMIGELQLLTETAPTGALPPQLGFPMPLISPVNMTGNAIPSPFVASASSEYQPAWGAFETNTATPGYQGAWVALSMPAWLRIDLGAAAVAARYAITGDMYSSLSAWTLEGSNDGVTWTVLDTQAGLAFGNGTVILFPVANPGSYRYYQLNISAAAGNNPCVKHLSLFTGGAAPPPVATPVEFAPHDLTSGTSHWPFVVTASSQTGQAASEAFDGSTGDYWNGTGGGTDWLQLDTASSYVLTSYKIFCGAGNGANGPSAWTMEGSNDGAAWTTLDTQTGVSGWAYNNGKTFAVSVAAAYRYFRINVTAINGGSQVEIDELYLIGTSAIGATPQTITFPATWPLAATSDSGLPVSYLVTAAPTETGGVISTTVMAFQHGNPTYAAATSVTNTFTFPTQFAPQDMSSDTSHAPFVASASTASSSAFVAFNGNTGNTWQGAGGSVDWLQLDTGTAFLMVAYEIFCGAGNPADGPSAWQMQGSNDGSTWTTLDTQSGISGWSYNHGKCFILTAPGSTQYRYFRINVTAINGGSQVQFDLLNLFNSSAPPPLLTAQTITFAAIPGHLEADAPFNLAATSDSGLAVSYAVTSGPATVSGTTVTLTGPGSVTIQATQAGNGTYAAATPVSQTFAVGAGPAAQTITFPPISNGSANDPPFALIGTASSGLPLAYAVTTGLATISGNVVTITGVGTVTIQATQAGNGAYAAATPVSQSFTVSPAQRGCIAYDQIKASDRTGNGNQLLTYSPAPASATSPGTPGQVAFDAAGYWYFCYGVNQWGRIGPTGYGSAAASPPSW